MQNKSLIIIGAGAAGLTAAVTAARRGLKVTLLEQNTKAGKKILVSGNGKCNITNRHITPSRFHSQNPEFIHAVLDGYAFYSIENFFSSLGLPLTEGKEGQMFPMSLQASTVSEFLLYEAEVLGVTLVTSCEVHSIQKQQEHFILHTSQGLYRSESLLLASGSPAAPHLGGNNSGLTFAECLGHSLIPTLPVLTQLVSEEKWCQQASGVKLSGVAKLYANGHYVTEKKGDLLFTDYGISGLAILDISREVSLRLSEYAYCELALDLMPTLHKAQLTNLLLQLANKKSPKPLALRLQSILHKKLVPLVLEKAKLQNTTEAQLNRKTAGQLVYTLKHLKLPISDTRGFKGAEAASGGVNTLEIDPDTMASKVVPNLYFAGEIVDVDGDRGGFNFHFAWVSGIKAGMAV